MILALLAFAQASPDVITLTPSRPASSQVIVKTRCLSNNFVISIVNDGFVSKLERATVNDKPVAFSSAGGDQPQGVDLARKVSQMHSVYVTVGQCHDHGNVSIFLNGVDMDRSSSDFGKPVQVSFLSKVH